MSFDQQIKEFGAVRNPGGASDSELAAAIAAEAATRSAADALVQTIALGGTGQTTAGAARTALGAAATLNGAGAPSDATDGANGDFWIRTSNWTIYGPKTAGAWGAPTSIIGATGATGAAGAAGVVPDAGTTSLSTTHYSATLTTRPEPLTSGYAFLVKFNATNLAASDIALSAGTAQPLYSNGAALPAGAIVAGCPYLCRSNGTQVEVLGEVGALAQLDGKQAILSASNKLSMLALPLALAAAGPDLLSTYEAELAGVCPWYCPSPGAETVTKVMDSTAPGGVCWHFESTGDQAGYEIPVRIPVQTDKAYTLSIWTKAGTNDSISYCGLSCYAGDGTSLGFRYCCKHGGGNNASWTRWENCITGEGTMGYPTYQFPVGTKYVQISLGPLLVYTGPRDIYVAAPAFREVERGNYSDAGGTADALTVNPYPQWTSYVNNAVIRFKAASNNTGSATINVSGIGDLTLYKHGRVLLAANDLIADAIYEAHYSTVNSGTMQLMSTPIVHATGNVSGGSAPALAAAGIGGTSQPASATQSGWLAIADTAGVVRYVPCWT